MAQAKKKHPPLPDQLTTNLIFTHVVTRSTERLNDKPIDAGARHTSTAVDTSNIQIIPLARLIKQSDLRRSENQEAKLRHRKYPQGKNYHRGCYVLGFLPLSRLKLIPRNERPKSANILPRVGGELAGGRDWVNTILELVERLKTPIGNAQSEILCHVRKEHGDIKRPSLEGQLPMIFNGEEGLKTDSTSTCIPV